MAGTRLKSSTTTSRAPARVTRFPGPEDFQLSTSNGWHTTEVFYYDDGALTRVTPAILLCNTDVVILGAGEEFPIAKVERGEDDSVTVTYQNSLTQRFDAHYPVRVLC